MLILKSCFHVTEWGQKGCKIKYGQRSEISLCIKGIINFFSLSLPLHVQIRKKLLCDRSENIIFVSNVTSIISHPWNFDKQKMEFNFDVLNDEQKKFLLFLYCGNKRAKNIVIKLQIKLSLMYFHSFV
jgi:hypothetical protein